MSKQRRRIEKCSTCGRQTNHAYICRKCANECHDLLVGGTESDSQPGIAWYVKRLRESAYGQTRMARSLAAKSSSTGYALFGNRRAAELLARINVALARWEAVVMRLRATQHAETGWVHTGSPTKDSERLEVKRARFIAAHVVLIRHHCPDAPKLHAEMLDCARLAWRIINRPNDICCGPCPQLVDDTTDIMLDSKMIRKVKTGKQIPCGTLLYAEEGANGVQCPVCHTKHDVEALRDMLKTQVADMLFTREELTRLMETRLNDRIPHATFGKLLRDGRLQPRHVSYDEMGRPVDMFTYNDVCEARLKPGKKPGPKARVSS